MANAAQCATYLLQKREVAFLSLAHHIHTHAEPYTDNFRVFLQNVKPSPSSQPPVIRGILFGWSRRKGRDGKEAKGKRGREEGTDKRGRERGGDKRGREKGDMKEGKEKGGDEERGDGREGTGKGVRERGDGKEGTGKGGLERGDGKEGTGKRGREIGTGKRGERRDRKGERTGKSKGTKRKGRFSYGPIREY